MKNLSFVGTVQEFRNWLSCLVCNGEHESIQEILDCDYCSELLKD